MISHSYPYFLGAANEHFSCRKQFILPPLGARSKPSSGPSGSFLLFWLNYGKLSVPAALNISSCVTETISWQLFLDDLEPCLWRKQLYLFSVPYQPFISSVHVTDIFSGKKIKIRKVERANSSKALKSHKLSSAQVVQLRAVAKTLKKIFSKLFDNYQ